MTDSIIDHLVDWADRAPARRSISQDDSELTYAELRSRVETDAGRLRTIGVRHGDRILLSGVNTVDWVCAFLGGLRLGAIVVPLNSRLGDQQVGPLARLVEAKVALVDATQWPIFKSAEVPTIVPVYLLATDAGPADRFESVTPARDIGSTPVPDEDSAALISFTSGTTGDPKGVVISHGSLVACATSYLPHLQLGSCPTTTVLVPIFHNTGYVDQLCVMLITGGAVDLVPRFRTERAVHAMQQRPPSYLALVPSILRMLMLSSEADAVFSRCEAVLCGGAPTPPAWSRELLRRWPRVRLISGYGLTEFTSGSHLLPSDQQVNGDAAGFPLDGVECSIRDTSGAECPPGEAGEVWLRGPMRMNEYWRDPEATAATVVGGWLRTGDRGTADADGLLRLLGRMDEVINRGGEKVQPTQVEDLMSNNDDVAEVAVVGLPDSVLGQRVAAAIVLKPGRELETEQVLQSLHGRIPDYAVPELVLAVESLPHGSTGKLDRPRTTELLSRLVASSPTCRQSPR